MGNQMTSAVHQTCLSGKKHDQHNSLPRPLLYVNIISHEHDLALHSTALNQYTGKAAGQRIIAPRNTDAPQHLKSARLR